MKAVFGIIICALSFMGARAQADIQQEVLADLQAQTKTLSRPILVYHRFIDPGLPRTAPQDPYWMEVVIKGRAPLFFKSDASRDLFGPSIYAAADPTSSMPFGKMLVEIEIATGTRFLDVRSGTADTEDGIKFRKSTFENLNQICPRFKAINAKPYYKGKEPWVSVKKADVYNGEQCRTIMNTALKQLEIQFLVYDWYSPDSDKNYKPCDRNSATAFVVMGKLMDSGDVDFKSIKVRGFYPTFQFNLDFSADEATRREEKLSLLKDEEHLFSQYHFIHEFSKIVDVKKRGHDSWSIFDDVSGAAPAPAIVQKIKRSRFQCDLKSYPEDKSPSFKNSVPK